MEPGRRGLAGQVGAATQVVGRYRNGTELGVTDTETKYRITLRYTYTQKGDFLHIKSEGGSDFYVSPVLTRFNPVYLHIRDFIFLGEGLKRRLLLGFE